MTQAEKFLATKRLEFLEKTHSLPEETIADLKEWWAEKLRQERRKVIPFDPNRRRWL